MNWLEDVKNHDQKLNELDLLNYPMNWLEDVKNYHPKLNGLI
jgi:hypothetical protein